MQFSLSSTVLRYTAQSIPFSFAPIRLSCIYQWIVLAAACGQCEKKICGIVVWASEFTTSKAEMKRANRTIVGKRTELADKLHNICTKRERCLCLYTSTEWYTQMVWHLPFNIWVFSTSSAVVGFPAHFQRSSNNKIHFKHTHTHTHNKG